MSKYPFGIDLGTTNSALGIYTGGTVETVKINGRTTIPSVVWYKSDGSVVVGTEAYDRKGQSDVIYSTKRDMGTDTVYHLVLEDGTKKDVTPIEVASEVLKAIINNSDKLYGTVDEAAITVPAYFNDNQRTATRKAAELAGIKVIAMINEPTAAAFAYGINKKNNFADSVIVVDVGGGTTDITYMSITNFDSIESIPEKLRDYVNIGLSFDVIATGGNNRLGGDDYDEAIINSAKARLLSENAEKRKSLKDIKDGTRDKKLAENTHNEKFLRENFTVDKYKPIIEKWKRIAQVENEMMSVSCVSKDGERKEYIIKTDDVKSGFSQFWNKINKCIDDTMNVYETNENGEQNLIGTYMNPSICIPVGGSTKNEWLLKCIQDKFESTGMEIPNTSFADEAIALGAAVKAAMVKGVETNITLKEINPLPIGIETVGERNGKMVSGIFYPVIQKDITVPVRQSIGYETTFDNQTIINVNVYQGVSNLIANNQCLGSFQVCDLPPRKAGEVNVQLIFSVDIDGMLTISAICEGKEKTVKFNSVLNSDVRKYTKAEERTMKYLLSVKDYMESIGDTKSDDYNKVSTWIPGQPIPEYALKHKKEISDFVKDVISKSLTHEFAEDSEELEE